MAGDTEVKSWRREIHAARRDMQYAAQNLVSAQRHLAEAELLTGKEEREHISQTARGVLAIALAQIDRLCEDLGDRIP